MSLLSVLLGTTGFRPPRTSKRHAIGAEASAKILAIFETKPIVTSEEVNQWMNYTNRASGTNMMLRLEEAGWVEHAGYERINRRPVSTWRIKNVEE